MNPRPEEAPMPLDMTGEHSYNGAVHYRRYLNRDDRIIVICVQDFDYPDYDASRFVDLTAFDSELGAEFGPLSTDDVTDQAAALDGDSVAIAQSRRLIRAINQHRLQTLA
ncbi:hypothetical protein [Streptomyces sioyaensis]|uniref:hypothetical protein n=1 Tax=Streptomyces sioyaensis TaxID=67364 RepID=UPI00378AFB7C